MRMDARARQDVAFLGSEFLKLDGNIPQLAISNFHAEHQVQYFDQCCL